MTVDTLTDLAATLGPLGLQAENPGAFDGAWIDTTGERVESINPATGESIAAVRLATRDEYERVAAASEAAFHAWRSWPAPRRGGAPAGRGPPPPQAGARAPGVARGGEDPLRGPGRGAGDDRHGRPRGG